ncbi:hypothetical protein BKA70DRAFT_778268 [Coprinopsis sp. MPI-PUGE-AT-0042]|nr:hypothetical protein BKA70DRAFT_778268 [Coprinopsis sp. MPI-PUGE-AT-0042]
MLPYFENETSLPYVPDDLSLAQFMLDHRHEIQPERHSIPCLIDSSTSEAISLDQLRRRTDGLAAILQHRYHIGPNSTVLIASPNHVDYPVVIWAVHRLGGIVTCSNPQFTAEELSYQLTTCKPSILVAHSGNLQILLSALKMAGLPTSGRIVLMNDPLPSSSKCDGRGSFASASISSLLREHHGQAGSLPLSRYIMGPGEGREKIAFLGWSSGTTGHPKAVCISHHAIISNIVQMATHNGVTASSRPSPSKPWSPGDVSLGVLPFYHVAGLVIALHLSLFCAMTVVVVPKYDLRHMLRLIERHSISHLFLVPPQAIALSKNSKSFHSDRTPPHIKFILIGAAPVSPHVQQSLTASFPVAQVGQAYGLTEMTTTVAMVSSTQQRPPLGSAGKLLPGIKARVHKADGRLAKCGERGELFVRGPSRALGYYKNYQATEETFLEGWVRTGDEVTISEDNEVFVFDRVKELLKVNGFQVAPAELEGCLLGHPFVDDACVVGIPHPLMGEIPLAYIVPSPSVVARVDDDESKLYHLVSQEITQYVATRTAGYKHLRGGIRFIESIPKSPSGKILRRVLRARLNDHLIQSQFREEKFTVRAKL